MGKEKEYTAGEGWILWQTGRYLLYANSLAPTPINCGKVFSSSPALFPCIHTEQYFLQRFLLLAVFLFSATKWAFFLQDLKQLNKWWAASDSAQRPCPSACSHQHSLQAACSQTKSQAWILRQERVRDRVMLAKEVLYSKETVREKAFF